MSDRTCDCKTLRALLRKMHECMQGHMIGINCRGPVLDDETAAAVRAALSPTRKEEDDGYEGMYRGAVRVIHALAKGRWGELATVNEDYQCSVDEIVVKIRAVRGSPPAPQEELCPDCGGSRTVGFPINERDCPTCAKGEPSAHKNCPTCGDTLRYDETEAAYICPGCAECPKCQGSKTVWAFGTDAGTEPCPRCTHTEGGD